MHSYEMEQFLKQGGGANCSVCFMVRAKQKLPERGVFIEALAEPVSTALGTASEVAFQ